MNKRRFDSIFLALGLALLWGASAVHHHGSHDGGIYAPHVDCTVCFGTPRRDGLQLVQARDLEGSPHRLAEGPPPPPLSPFSTSRSLLPFGRAPPTLP